MVVSVDMGIDDLHETGRFSTFYTVNVVHAFTSGMGCETSNHHSIHVHCLYKFD